MQKYILTVILLSQRMFSSGLSSRKLGQFVFHLVFRFIDNTKETEGEIGI